MKTTVYSGTREDNYRTCAYLDKEGNVFFNKNREPRHQHSLFFFTEKVDDAASWAIFCARNGFEQSSPLILEGKVEGELNEYGQLPYCFLDKGEAFPVSHIWIANEGVNMKTLRCSVRKNLYRYFKRICVNSR